MGKLHQRPSKRKKKTFLAVRRCQDGEFVRQVQDVVNDDPRKSMRTVAKQLEVAEPTIRPVVHGYFRHQSYVMRRGQISSQRNQENPAIAGSSAC